MPNGPLPNPTAAEIYADIKLSGLRLSKVWTGLIEIMETHLPDVIEEYNADNNLSDTAALKAPNDYLIAGTDLSQKESPLLVVGGEREFIPAGCQTYLGDTDAVIWMVYPKANAGKTAIEAADLADLAAGVALQFQVGYMNRQNQRVFLGLTATQVRAIPSDETSQYGGFYFGCKVIQGPSNKSDLWKPVADE